MKQIVSIILIFFISISLNTFGQKFRTLEQYQNYFIENYKTLDKIEGIWYIVWNQQFNNNFQHLEPYTVAIIKESSDFMQYMIVDGNYEPISALRGFVQTTSGYKYFEEASRRKYADLVSFYNPEKFTFKWDHTQSLRNDGINVKICVWSYTYSKIYPLDVDLETAKSRNSKIESTGTGFAISSNGIIVTNYHVIEPATSIVVRGINADFSKTYKAKVLISDKNNDLALIQIEDYGFSSIETIPYTLKSNLAGVGENIFVLGYPLRATMGDEVKLTNGIISSRTGFQGDITSYQISAPVQPGNSGGPLFDSQGNLIGIINAKHAGAENVSYAVKSSYLKGLIELLPYPPILQTSSALTGKSLTEQVEIVKKFVFIIEIE